MSTARDGFKIIHLFDRLILYFHWFLNLEHLLKPNEYFILKRDSFPCSSLPFQKDAEKEGNVSLEKKELSKDK